MKNDELFDFGFYVDEDNSGPSLRKANVYLLRGEYDEALKMYQELLDNDINNIDAYLGILRVHSKDYTIVDNDEVAKDIYIIRKYYKDSKIEDFECVDFIKRYDALEEEKAEKLVKLQKEIDFEKNQLEKMKLEYKNVKQKNEEYLKEYHRKKEQKARELKEKEEKAKALEEARALAEKEAKEKALRIAREGSLDASENTTKAENKKENAPSKPQETKKSNAKLEIKNNEVIKVLSNEEVIVIEEGITKINQEAFAECTKIRELHLPNSIKDFAIYFDLDSLYYDGTVEDWCNKVKWSGNSLESIKKLFFKNKQVTSLVIPSSVKKIRIAAFSGLTLSKLSFDYGLEVIGDRAFAYTKVLDTVVLPYSLKEIEECAFEYADIPKMKFCQYINKIGANAFNSSKIEEIIGFENTKVEKISACAFANMDNLKSIQLPETLQSIGQGAFRMNDKLIFLKIPKSVNDIQDEAFCGCFSLTIGLRVKKPLFSDLPKFFSKKWRGDYSTPKVEYTK